MKISFIYEGATIPEGLSFKWIRGRTWGPVIVYRRKREAFFVPAAVMGVKCDYAKIYHDMDGHYDGGYLADIHPYPIKLVHYTGWRFRWRAYPSPHFICRKTDFWLYE